MPNTSKSSIITDPSAPPEWIKPHPGEMLREEYLAPLTMSASELARQLGVPANRVTAILNGDRSVSADTAWRLARFWNTSPDYWMNLQKTHDLSKAWIENGSQIERDVTPRNQENEAA